jgi:hypothetical protein
MSNEPLRGCPTCGTKVSEVALGPRDYRWVSPKLPGKVAPMDIDFMLERNGHILVIEFKPMTAKVPAGQARTLRSLRRFADVWVMYGDGPMVDIDWGDGRTRLSLDEVAAEVVLWFEEAGNA